MNTVIEKNPDWQVAGLPGRPYFLNDDLDWRPTEAETVLRDPSGKPILCREYYRSVEAMTAYLGSGIYAVRFVTNGQPEKLDVEQYGKFGFMCHSRLSMVQRSVISAFAWLFDTHIAPIPANECYILPRDLNPDCDKRRVTGQRGFASEEKAYMAVEAIADQLHVEGRVFEDGGGWYVDIPDCEEIGDMERVVRLSAIIEMVFSFDITPSGYTWVDDGLDGKQRGAHVARLDAKSSRLNCIEQKLDALLAGAGENIEAGDHRDKHMTGAAKPAGKKSSPKRSA